VQLALHCFFQLPERTFLTDNDSWQHNPEVVSKVPRALVFLDLPSYEDTLRTDCPQTNLIPTAAEFEDGTIDPLFLKLEKKNGERPPTYPEPGEGYSTLEALNAARKEYWNWFRVNFSSTQAMRVLEQAASLHGRIRWVDYRAPLTHEGDSIHLHICPAGSYDTGIFAYNFIKRGFKHGMRIIGTLKSEPDINVLALYEK
jgi:hypothetical protein